MNNFPPDYYDANLEDTEERNAPTPPAVLVCEFCGIEDDDKRATTACVSLKNQSGFHRFIKAEE